MPEGFFSPADFTGAPVGGWASLVPVPPFPVGMLLSNFIGFGVGPFPVTGPITITGKTKKVAGPGGVSRSHVQRLAAQVQYQTLLDQQTHNASQHAILKLTQKITEQHLEYERQLFRQKQTATWAAVLSEV